MDSKKEIYIKGAKVNNLKNIDISIPRNRLVVITGLSGSGKSSLAFDTLYAEGQRRYVESLSSYARQFLGRMSKPEVDYIKGLPPAIAIEQKVNSRNSRSTVGTSTEIYEYVKLLYARAGKTYSPISGCEVVKHSAQNVVETLLQYPKDTKILLLIKINFTTIEELAKHATELLQSGYSRIYLNNEIVRINEVMEQISEINIAEEIYLVVDRLVIDSTMEGVSRLTESLETAFVEGRGRCYVNLYLEKENKIIEFSKGFEADGITFEEPNENMFSFNNPIGACEECNGFGNVIGIDEKLVVPNVALSIYDDAVVCWRGESMKEWKQELIYAAEKFNFPIHTPYCELTEIEREELWHGNKYFAGIDGFFKFIESNQYKIQYRVMLSRYRGKTLCPICKGKRLKKEAIYVKIGGKSITDLVDMPISQLSNFFKSLTIPTGEEKLYGRLLTEINSRIEFMLNVGLGYLTLNRLSKTLSGGESQRINLVTSLGSSLVGSLYILDEPSIGLHSRDTERLIKVLKQLRDIGNSVVVVEHDEEIIREADYIIDIGRNAGTNGGEVMFAGEATEIAKAEKHSSYTIDYLMGYEKIDIPIERRKWNNYIVVNNCNDNNLKNISVKFPLNVMTVVTGVSGSGKSTLVNDTLYNRLKRYYDGTANSRNNDTLLGGALQLTKHIELIDQNPIGKSSRSNPVTYIKAYDDIRKLYADQQLSKQMGYQPSHFSFNTPGGRCEECKGDGTILIEMQFMADIQLPCEMCGGKRFQTDLLEVKYKGKSIYDILELTIDDAIELFSQKQGAIEKRVVKRLKSLQDVGIGYLKLGQPSSTLSGGESQRVKLASFLSQEKTEPTIFIFDEPTTGLHFHDINVLLRAFNALIAKGHTLIIIEHNMDVIKCADHVIDLGTDGGADGGRLIFAGTPEELIHCKESYTAKHLNQFLIHNS